MELIVKICAIGILLMIVFNLFKAMICMLNPKPDQPSMSEFIGKRLKFSVFLVLLLLLCLVFGVITPNPSPY
ncbi:MAG: DUF2909 family protein [Gammaproteobacteria bacterium]|nr:DUF2909 family protein [Gammaproteobacteria bacterium]